MKSTRLIAICNDCETEFSMFPGNITNGASGNLNCPLCHSNVLRVTIDVPGSEWDGTLEQNSKQRTS